jgi:hypothetical protein
MDAGPESGPGRARRRPPPPPPIDDVDDDLRGGEVSLLRRFVTAALVLAAAFSVGIAMAVVWQQVGGSDDSGAAGTSPTAGASAGTPTTAPTASATGPAPTAVPVPADWVAYTDATQQATFSHPPNWGQRNSETGVFFSEPANTASGFGAQMIGVARSADTSAQQAVTNVQQSEFGTAGLTNFTPGTPTESNDGSGAWGVSGSYDREGQRVAYVMKSIQAPTAVYVLIVRGPADQQQQILTLLGALQSSFAPVNPAG